MYFSKCFDFLNFFKVLESPEFQNLEIFMLFFRNCRDEVIS